jgi:hypothetical protein
LPCPRQQMLTPGDPGKRSGFSFKDGAAALVVRNGIFLNHRCMETSNRHFHFGIREFAGQRFHIRVNDNTVGFCAHFKIPQTGKRGK